jgi:hypothetical protein
VRERGDKGVHTRNCAFVSPYQGFLQVLTIVKLDVRRLIQTRDLGDTIGLERSGRDLRDNTIIRLERSS